MSRAMRVTIDPRTVSPSETIRASAGLAPLTMISGRMLLDLSDELDGYQPACRFLLGVAEDLGRPVGVNVPTPDGSRSMFLAPRSWSRERLAGWVAGHHQDLEAAFGPVTPVAKGER